MLERTRKHPSAFESENTQIFSDLGRQRITVPEAFWRLNMLTTHSVIIETGNSFATMAAATTAVQGTDESVILPEIIEAAAHKYLAKHSVSASYACSQQAATMWAWGFGKGVYDIDDDVVETVLSASTVAVSSTVLQHIPQRSLFISTKVNDCIGAFFHHFVVPTTQKAYCSFECLKSDWSAPGAERLGTISCTLDLSNQASVIGDMTSDDASELDEDTVRKYLNLLLLLCCKNVEIVGCVTSKPGPSVDFKTKKPVMTTTPRHWNVGVRQGAALRAAYATTSSKGGTHQSPRAHMRRAHWATYYTGPRTVEARPSVLHWIAPILVGAAEDIVETHHRVGATT
jgi:hypothetical protein